MMPHLIPLQNPPELSLARGISSNRPLGYEVLLYDGDPGQRDKIHELRAAIGNIANSTNAAESMVRGYVDQRYASSMAGAPADFPFRVEDGGSILTTLSTLDDSRIIDFCIWNSRYTIGLRQHIATYAPQLYTHIQERIGYLVDAGLLPAISNVMARSAIRKIAQHGIMPLDSFEGGLHLGMTDSAGCVSMTHLFEGGLTPGKPTEEFWETGVHEGVHATAIRAGGGFTCGIATTIPLGPSPQQNSSPVCGEEAIVEHLSVISNPNSGFAADISMYEAARLSKSYSPLRKMFGLICERGHIDIPPNLLGEALMDRQSVESTPRSETERRLITNCRALFPEYGEGAFWTIMQAYNSRHPCFRGTYATDMSNEILARTNG